MIQISLENEEKIVDEHFKSVKNMVRTEVLNKKERTYVENNLETIIKAKRLDFQKIIAETKSFNKKKLSLAFIGSQKKKKFTSGSFNGYNKFSNKYTLPYSAYSLAEKINLNVCPYCNRNYTYTIKSSNSKSVRPEFDHFICKKSHPIFALSFYNLIPSCSICNSSLKGQSKFSYKTHVHPYFDSFNDLKKFNVNNNLLSIITEEDEFDIVFEDIEGTTFIEKEIANNHIKDFALKTQYSKHKDKVLELIDISRAYNDASFQNLVNEFSKSTKIFKEVDDVKRLMLCHHIEDNNIDKRPLNKLIKDISEKLRLI